MHQHHEFRARGRRAALLLAAAAFGLATAGAANAKPGDSFDHVTWDASGGGADSSQYSALDQINKDNVARLVPAWSYKTGPGQGPHFNPLLANGSMYILVGGPRGAGSSLVALDPATGAEKWRKLLSGGAGSRGMNYWQSKDGKDKRLLFVMNGALTAVSADTGELIGTFGTNGAVDLRVGLDVDISKVRPLQTDNPGRIFEDTIVMSLPAGGAGYTSAPADIHAYDIVTGKLKWRFHTVPQKGEEGYDSWPEKDHEQFGGVHNWSESTMDPETGIIYIPTGTARFDFYGGNREGDNLYGNSLLALDARTGKKVWHYQLIHHDLWDFDNPQAPKLLTIHKDGKDIPVVIQATKFGFLFVFNRLTGEPIWPIEERAVPKSDVPGEKASPTQPFPTWPKPFARQSFTEAEINPYLNDADKAKLHELFKTARNEGLFTPPSLQGSISMPGHNGGANWGTSSVDPVKGRFFVVSKQLPTYDKLTLPTGDQLARAQASQPNGGGDVQPYASGVDFMLQSDGQSAIAPPWSLITAYDMNTGDIMWSVPNGEVTEMVKKGIRDTGSVAPRGGPVATAGGLVFVGTSSDRKIRARDADTGKVLWEFELPAATEGVPAVYKAGGREYLVIGVGGDGLFAPQLGQIKPTDADNQYMAFALPQAGN
ncbi:MAG: pyrroloquinoline quinone-dependent dehydrogenase [Candidatus Andeanibacterium colombiense]|uniref:Pyrroloquinoline quinone-dependent dehydrogenase n=1 Tax=Candidatus Andeanibacterium colombiense TaxID=3121345 RepID=A0AAJ5X959_9SPHN|nr:MAG: pyrroloquinoline quinone-dependent dehydrogenase [Sphingomonadaceae bacterium]